MEIKLPEGFDDREDAIRELIRREDKDQVADLPHIRESVRDFLIKNKGYREEDIERDRNFEVIAGGQRHTSSADFVISLEGKSCMVIKCVPGSLESRERHAMVIGRLIEMYQIPYSIMTDGMNASVLDTVSGKVIAEGFASIPSRAELQRFVAGRDFPSLSPEKREMAARVLCAFDSLQCQTEGNEKGKDPEEQIVKRPVP